MQQSNSQGDQELSVSESVALPRWAAIKKDYIDLGLPHRLVLRSTPGLHVFTDAAGARIGARFEVANETPHSVPSKLQQITVQDVMADGKRWLEVAASSPALFESFYRLIEQISAAVLLGEPAQAALDSAVGAWDTLVQQISLLSEERQAGLFGELLFLERLLLNGTVNAIDAWVGPNRQPHDFRIGSNEFEVKTTGGQARVHTINGLTQLQASTACSLYLISIQLTDGGAGGILLPELVHQLRQVVSASDLLEFNRRLKAAGYEDSHAAHYPRRRRLRSKMAMIAVLDGTPRLTAQALALLPAEFATSRISDLTYRADFTGLGVLDGTAEFLAVTPAVMRAEDV